MIIERRQRNEQKQLKNTFQKINKKTALDKQLKTFTWKRGVQKLLFCEWPTFAVAPQLIFYTSFKTKILKEIKSQNLICF